jgi:ABC-2 type transport system ATP-binding protein
MVPAISVENLHKQYVRNSTPTLNGVTFQVQQGEVFGLLGPNGAGKTTIIRTLCGLLSCETGQVSILGLNHRQHNDRIKRIIGVVPQEIALFPTLTAYENLRYFGKLHGMKESVIKDRVFELLNDFGLSAVAHRQVGRFSGGMKRIVNLLAGIIHGPMILFLDEPTAGVDAHSRSLILSRLKELNRSGMTMIYTSHLLKEAQDICTHIMVIEKGSVVVQGSITQLIQDGGLEEFFLRITSQSSHEH